ncbi:MAG: stage III sporulation protein AG [Clostridiaceae bacterium]|jgi:stage III sporulation protein AG|nr:stage III sporulation protein AG [Clostridiaceae bacterium]
MSNWFEKLKVFIQDKKGRRGIENLVIILILGVIIIIVAGSFFEDDDKAKKKNDEAVEAIALVQNKAEDEIRELEKRLEQILSEIKGAGNVKVMVTGNSDGEVVHAYNHTEESVLREEQDGTRALGRAEEIRVQKELVFMDSGSGRVPVVIQKNKPEIRGVLVVADGADSISVRGDILNAVEALLGIPRHRIQVLKRK